MIKFKRADHIHICVSPERLEEARAFYADVLGLQQIERPYFKAPGYWFAISDIELHIGIEEPLPSTIRHSAFEVTDLAAARALLESKGVVCKTDTIIPGRDRFTFIDPFGNRMELLEYHPL
jgi:catechol 2,3-dioxygenase-like lactoylglutathione lyase family enzyme